MSARDDYPRPGGADYVQWSGMCGEIDRLRTLLGAKTSYIAMLENELDDELLANERLRELLYAPVTN